MTILEDMELEVMVRIKFKNLSLELKTYTEENKKELTTIEEEINNFRKELESKVE